MVPPEVDLGGGTLQPFILVLRLVMEIDFLAHLVIRKYFIVAVREMRGGSPEIVAACKVILSLREASVIIAACGDGLGTAEVVQRVEVFEAAAIFLIEVATVYPLLTKRLHPVTLASGCAIVENAWSVTGAFVRGGHISHSLFVLTAVESATSEA